MICVLTQHKKVNGVNGEQCRVGSAAFVAPTTERVEDTEGTRICGCPSLLSNGCPKSGELLSLHYID